MDKQARRKKTTPEHRTALYELYRRRMDRIDSWDLVHLAARHVVGLYLKDRRREPLYELARSADPWERRTAMYATWIYVREDDLDDCFAIAELLADDEHDLVRKVVGGMVREAGKHDVGRLRAYLDAHAATLPRVTLRYAVEHLDADERARYLAVAGSGPGA